MLQLVECLGFTVVCNVAAIALLAAVRRWAPPERLRRANDVAAAYFGVIGTMYAVILGFMLIECWGRFMQVREGVQMESVRLAQIYRLAEAEPEPMRHQLRAVVVDYARVMVDQEWTDMDEGRMSAAGAEAYNRLWNLVEGVKAPNNESDVILDKLMDSLIAVGQARHLRELKINSTLPPLLWAVLIVGGVIVVSFSCVLGVERFELHTFKLVALTTLICITLYAIEEIDGPFTGSLRIDSHPFKQLLTDIEVSGRGPGPSSAPSSH